MGSSGNLSKLVIPKQHWQGGEQKEKAYNAAGTTPGGSSSGASRSRVRWWVAFCLCAGLVVVPLLMFMCAIDNMEAVGSKRQPWISLDRPPLEFIGVRSRWSLLRKRTDNEESINTRAALQGMGTLLRMGTRPMHELIVAHLDEDTSSEELRLFMRSLHRSGSTARADVVLLFPSSPMPTAMANVIQEEEDSFQKLLADAKPSEPLDDQAPSEATVNTESEASMAAFNATKFRRSHSEVLQQQEVVPAPEIIWGKRHGEASPSPSTSWASWGSIVSFDIQELDPQDALAGFFDTSPVQLRRWLCYDMLLGMIKSRYKNVLVSQVKGVYVLGDALSVARKKPMLYITGEDRVWRDAKLETVTTKATKAEDSAENDRLSTVVDLSTARTESIRRSLRESSKALKDTSEAPRKVHQGLIQSVYGQQVWKQLEEQDKQHVVVSTAVIMGGVQYVCGLANKMTSEIVRVAIERKSRESFHDKAVLNMWVHKKAALGKRIADHLRVVKNQDSVVHSLQGSNQPSLYSSRKHGHQYLVVHDHALAPSSLVREELCRLDPNLYQRCL